MKVNIILPFTHLTGGIRVVFLYSNYLIAQGHEVICYVPMKAYKFNSSILKNVKASIGNTIKRGSKVSWFECKFKIKLVPIIKNAYIENADITIATAWPTAYDVEKLNISKGKKVYFIQGYEIWSGNKEKVDKSYTLNLNRVVVTKELETTLFNKFNVNSTVIYNGLEENEYIVGEKNSKNLKNILMLYNELPIKGAKEGIKILKEIYKKYNVEVVLFGYNRGRDIPAEFKFYENPRRNVLLNLYREADIYLFPSKQEAWGLTVMEAMANKCAVVGNNVGCLKEFCKNGREALIVDGLNYTEMLVKVEALLDKEELLKEIQLNGYILSQKFTWEKSYKIFEEYLSSI